MQRQYSGTLGRVDNCQIGTFLAYVNSLGDRALIDRELYLPQGSWLGDRQRCAEAGIPPEQEFATRPAQVEAMIRRTVQAGVTFRWFTADEEFGQNPGLRDYLENAGLAYVMAIPKNARVTDPTGAITAIEDLPAQPPRTPRARAGRAPRLQLPRLRHRDLPARASSGKSRERL